MTATRCLHRSRGKRRACARRAARHRVGAHCARGVQVRAEMTTGMADLFMDLDNGFTHLAWVLPYWLPAVVPKRDAAHRAIKAQFYKIISRRRKSEPREDMLQTFLMRATRTASSSRTTRWPA